ncbi:CooT family nickel-binding protein [Desulfococcaceae bacterium HSG9]|nr:CooT family nickel-binding protein [Desulfococcaceae bacterium HSG9]
MCEATAFLLKDNEQVKVMEAVDTVEPEDGGVKLSSIFGDQKFINGQIHSLSLVDNKIFLTEH